MSGPFWSWQTSVTMPRMLLPRRCSRLSLSQTVSGPLTTTQSPGRNGILMFPFAPELILIVEAVLALPRRRLFRLLRSMIRRSRHSNDHTRLEIGQTQVQPMIPWCSHDVAELAIVAVYVQVQIDFAWTLLKYHPRPTKPFEFVVSWAPREPQRPEIHPKQVIIPVDPYGPATKVERKPPKTVFATENPTAKTSWASRSTDGQTYSLSKAISWLGRGMFDGEARISFIADPSSRETLQPIFDPA